MTWVLPKNRYFSEARSIVQSLQLNISCEDEYYSFRHTFQPLPS
jgi:hypothetical protein